MPSLDNKASHYLPQAGIRGFGDMSPLCLPLPGKAIKLSFSTSPKTLSPSFDLPPMYREAELSASAGDVPSQVGRESALLPPFSSIQGDAHPNCEVIFFYSVY